MSASQTLRRAAAILLGIVICLGIAWIYLRGRALSTHVPEPMKHAFRTYVLENRPAVIAYQGDSKHSPGNTLDAFKHAANVAPKAILWMDVRPSMDRVLIASESPELSTATNGSGWIQMKNYDEIRKLDAGYKFSHDKGANFPFRDKGLYIPTMKEVLETFPDRFFVLNFHDYKEGLAETILSDIESAKAGERVLIASSADGILKDLRELRPMWIFSTSQAQATRIFMLQEFGLESAIPLRGDVFITPVGIGADRFKLDDDLIRELQRRKLLILAGPAEGLVEKVDGILTSDPSQFESSEK